MRGVTKALEFWPEYEGGPLWTEQGASVDLDELGLPVGLEDRVVAWSRLYADDKLPMDGPGDERWLDDGRRVLAELREALQGRYEIVVTEPWWGDEAPAR